MAYEAPDIVDKALSRFDSIVETLQEERALCLQDRRFAFIAGAQWEEEGWSDMSENMIRVEVNKTALGLKRIQDDYRANRVTVNFRETTGEYQETADLLDGMFRADVYRCKGSQAFDNAFIEGSSGGIGAWYLRNEYEDEYDPDNEHQRICFDTIVDADQRVFWDPNSKLYDKSDAQFCFVLHAFTREAFAAEFGEDKIDSWPEGLMKWTFDWYQPDMIFVASYYAVEITNEKRRWFRQAMTGDLQAFWNSDLDDDGVAKLLDTGWIEQPSKMRKRRRVAKYTLSGAEELKPKKWVAGPNIPVVMFYGQRVYIDNIERCQGHVRQAKDPQRIYNSNISKMVEINALAPREVPIFYPDQVAGHQDSWANMNIDRAAYALINPLIDNEGNIVATGPIGKVEPPQLQPVQAALIQITANDIQELTGGGENADQVKSNVSAEAMDIAATRLDERDGSYMDNFRQSMQRCGEIYQGMAPEVYFEEGRKVQTMGEDGEQSEATLQEPFTDERGRHRIRHDLGQGKFNVIADVTEATATRRDKTVKACVNLADLAAKAGDNELVQACVGTAIENMDGEGIDDLKAWNRNRMVTAGIVKPTDEEREALEQAAQNQKPDPQSQALEAVAEKEKALAGKAVADTALSEAKAVETLASANLKAKQAGKTVEETQQIGRDDHIMRIKTGFEMDNAANDREAA